MLRQAQHDTPRPFLSFLRNEVTKNDKKGNEGTDEDTKEAIRGALTLYLDFLNLFLMLLRIMGTRR